MYRVEHQESCWLVVEEERDEVVGIFFQEHHAYAFADAFSDTPIPVVTLLSGEYDAP